MSRGELRRSNILDATLRVIALEGVRAVTHRRVAAEAEASVGLITYYFSSTDSLISATLDALAADEAKQMGQLQTRINEASGDIDMLTEILVKEVAERSHVRRDRALAGLALTLEIPRLSIDRVAFARWESAQEGAYAALLTALGREPEPELVEFLSATLDGLFLYAVITPKPENVESASRAGLAHLFRSFVSSDAANQARR
ncbi:TetR/AcrR family transcriptional regulator [Arthrobacter sp. 18067]|uniref:TetR/AcrR family transcriptional regulator n=1 Tax=Arthrobacter sp. 18067 TaxID=2681413 RepID=UPI00135C4756|nr:TetR family transcriptional regulator [Arthrobacter sp. 18067]